MECVLCGGTPSHRETPVSSATPSSQRHLIVAIYYILEVASQIYCIWYFQDDAEDLRYDVAISLLVYSTKSKKSKTL